MMRTATKTTRSKPRTPKNGAAAKPVLRPITLQECREHIREYVAHVRWSDIGDDAFNLGGELNEVACELYKIADIIGDQGSNNVALPTELREQAREIRAAVKRGFDALQTALKVAGFYGTIGDLENIAVPMPPLPPEDESN